MIYLLTVFPLALFSILSTFFKKLTHSTYLFIFLLLLVLILMASIRSGTGTDFTTYQYIWSKINPIDVTLMQGSTGMDYLEVGFRYFSSILKWINTSDVFFFSVMSLLTLGTLYAGLIKLEHLNIYVALSLYFAIFYMPYVFNGMRQAVTMSIFIYSLSYIMNGQFFKTLLLTIIAISFHFSGIIILISYFAARVKISSLSLFIVGTLLSLLLYYFHIPEKILGLLFPEKFSNYQNMWGALSNLDIFIRFALASLMVGIATYVIHNNYFSTLVNLYLLGFFLYLGFADAGMLATRLNMFFRILEIVLFSFLIYTSQSLINRLVYLILAFSLGGYILYKNILIEDNLYNTIFNTHSIFLIYKHLKGFTHANSLKTKSLYSWCTKSRDYLSVHKPG